jgi:hypothetical protein
VGPPPFFWLTPRKSLPMHLTGQLSSAGSGEPDLP